MVSLGDGCYQEHGGGMSDKEWCGQHANYESINVRWVLHSSVEDARQHVRKLTDDELLFCLKGEGRRITVGRMLEAEAKRRRAKAA